MPNGTYGGVRGRETKVIGGKLQESFVFLLLDFIGARPPQSPYALKVLYDFAGHHCASTTSD